MTRDERGVLYPGRLPSFRRLPAPDDVAVWVRWFWIPEWNLAPGEMSHQEIVAHPACNLVVEPDLVGLAGPTTRRSTRALTGRGWAVGALLRPAAVPDLVSRPTDVRDGYAVVRIPHLHRAVARAMRRAADAEARHADAVRAFSDWFATAMTKPDAQALLANAMVDVIDGDENVMRVGDVASRVGVSVRTLQRLADRYVGVSPAAMIRRRRLQRAAERLRDDRTADIATVAADLGYTDQAHLTNDFRRVLGFTPSSYRGGAAADSGGAAADSDGSTADSDGSTADRGDAPTVR